MVRERDWTKFRRWTRYHQHGYRFTLLANNNLRKYLYVHTYWASSPKTRPHTYTRTATLCIVLVVKVRLKMGWWQSWWGWRFIRLSERQLVDVDVWMKRKEGKGKQEQQILIRDWRHVSLTTTTTTTTMAMAMATPAYLHNNGRCMVSCVEGQGEIRWTVKGFVEK